MTIKVALLVDSPSRRAHGNAASRLALGLVETGSAEVTLVCYGPDPAPPWLPDAVTIHRLGVERASRALPALALYLRSQRPDVLIARQMHANFVALAAGAAARAAGGWRGRLVLVQDHIIQLTHASNWRDNKWLAKACYRFADGVIAPSPTVRENVIDWCGVDPSAAALVPNPIPQFSGQLCSPPHPWLRDGEPPVFINISNMMPFKRVDLLLDAFAEVRRSCDVRLLILGDGPTRPAVIDQIRRLRLADCAEAVGWIDEPMQFLWAAGRVYDRGRLRRTELSRFLLAVGANEDERDIAGLLAFAAGCWPEIRSLRLYRTLMSDGRLRPRDIGYMANRKARWWLRRRSWLYRGY